MKTRIFPAISSVLLGFAIGFPVAGYAQSIGEEVPSILRDLEDTGFVEMTNFDKAMAQGQSVRGKDAPTQSANINAQLLRWDNAEYTRFSRWWNTAANQ